MRESGNGERIRVAVQRLETENCPWPEELHHGRLQQI